MLSDVMIDCETLATTPDAAVLTIGAVKFDPFGDELNNPTAKKFYIKIDLDSCNSIGLRVSEDTIEWWGKQSKEAQEEAFGDDNRTNIADAINLLYKFCWGAKRVWSHGAGFDVIIIENIFQKVQKACPWKFWQVRDTRTLFDMGIDSKCPTVFKHHALEDALSQAIGVQNICRELLNKNIKMFKDLKNEPA